MSQKESIIDVISRLPDDAGFEDAIDEIKVLQRIEEREKAADEGRVR